jgi:hypothetical protein
MSRKLEKTLAIVCPSLSGLSKVGKEIIINSTIVEEKTKMLLRSVEIAALGGCMLASMLYAATCSHRRTF